LSPGVVFLAVLALLVLFFIASVAIEALVAKLMLLRVSWRQTLRSVVLANLLSHALMILVLAALIFSGAVGSGI
jgi:hypothetical protein